MTMTILKDNKKHIRVHFVKLQIVIDKRTKKVRIRERVGFSAKIRNYTNAAFDRFTNLAKAPISQETAPSELEYLSYCNIFCAI
jgi:hypothetical protein